MWPLTNGPSNEPLTLRSAIGFGGGGTVATVGARVTAVVVANEGRVGRARVLRKNDCHANRACMLRDGGRLILFHLTDPVSVPERAAECLDIGA